jgi:hypothetical protein
LTKNKARTNRNGTHYPEYGLWNKLLKFWIWLKPGDRIALFALGVAFLSLFFSVYQMYQSDESEHASIRPILEIYYKDIPPIDYSVILRNCGLGPALSQAASK